MAVVVRVMKQPVAPIKEFRVTFSVEEASELVEAYRSKYDITDAARDVMWPVIEALHRELTNEG